MIFLPKDQGVTLPPSEKRLFPLGWKSRNLQPDSVQGERLGSSQSYMGRLYQTPSLTAQGWREDVEEGAGRVLGAPRKQRLPNTTELTHVGSTETVTVTASPAQIQTRQIS